MLEPEEKAYCRALLALKRKDYRSAVDHFRQAAPRFRQDREFVLLRETTRLLLAVKEERKRISTRQDAVTKETFSHGQEDLVRG